MKIELHLFAAFSKYLPLDNKGRKTAITVNEGATIRDLLRQLGIPLSDIKLVSANGKQTTLEYRLLDGDRIGVYPPVSGG